ncbi:Endoglucanase E1 [Colletotrichum chlorophyti]|uniref:Endoglucanase E1 n=1 Tax=Colletotrichum chlorophyti TaxID=708187 RepID=A0A1Q8RBW8_9PEZI|nr:Endoglucanase E1 [Colletotrichum chlorophyti]
MLFASAAGASPTTIHMPLSVQDQWIVDSKNVTVPFVGVNWAGHQEPMIPEGLQYQSIKHIVKKIAQTGFNSVRLTFASEMVDDIVERGGDVTLKATLQKALGPENGTAVMNQIIDKNPGFNESTKRLEIWDAVAAELARQNLYLHLDNHMSKAGWCCYPDDGNGWFGDTYFNTSNWVRSLSFMAEHGKAANWTTFSGVGLRNELRPRLSTASPPSTYENDTWVTWKTRMVQGANAIHNANPDLLIFFGGMLFANDISAPVLGKASGEPNFNFTVSEFPFKDKFVFEQHQYEQESFFPVDEACTDYAKTLDNLNGNATIATSSITNRSPLIMTEWGHDQADKAGAYTAKFRRCLMNYMVDRRIPWMMWAIGGSYYIREGKQDRDEPWGLLDHTWSSYRGDKSIKLLQHDMERTYEAFNQTMPRAGKSPGNQNQGSMAPGGISVSIFSTILSILIAGSINFM